jgi:hypothetical protein
MSLSDSQIRELAKRMSIPLGDVCFKNELDCPLEFNKSYIINIEDSHDENGNENEGTHWTFLQCNKYPNDKIESIYFDSYGAPAPKHVIECVEKTTGSKGLPHTIPDIQSLLNNACGYYCLALGHFINSSQYRSGDLYNDVNKFINMFDDLNKSVDFKKNEYILKHFFRSSDENKRVPIDVDKISKDNEKGGMDAFKIPCDIKQL